MRLANSASRPSTGSGRTGFRAPVRVEPFAFHSGQACRTMNNRIRTTWWVAQYVGGHDMMPGTMSLCVAGNWFITGTAAGLAGRARQIRQSSNPRSLSFAFPACPAIPSLRRLTKLRFVRPSPPGGNRRRRLLSERFRTGHRC